MRIIGLLLFALILPCLFGFRILKGKDIPKDYAIGKISTVDFARNNRVFFRTIDDIMGLINS